MNKLLKPVAKLERSQNIAMPNFDNIIHKYLKKGYKPLGRKLPLDIDELRIKRTLLGEVH
jgi:hypothetical protein